MKPTPPVARVQQGLEPELDQLGKDRECEPLICLRVGIVPLVAVDVDRAPFPRVVKAEGVSPDDVSGPGRAAVAENTFEVDAPCARAFLRERELFLPTVALGLISAIPVKADEQPVEDPLGQILGPDVPGLTRSRRRRGGADREGRLLLIGSRSVLARPCLAGYSHDVLGVASGVFLCRRSRNAHRRLA